MNPATEYLQGEKKKEILINAHKAAERGGSKKKPGAF